MSENPSGSAGPKLLDQVRGKIRLKHYSIRTEQAYVDWIKRFILFFDKRHPKELGGAEVEAFLTHLAVEGKVSASTQNQAKSAILFLYREVLEIELPWLGNVQQAKVPKRLPVVKIGVRPRFFRKVLQMTGGDLATQLRRGQPVRVPLLQLCRALLGRCAMSTTLQPSSVSGGVLACSRQSAGSIFVFGRVASQPRQASQMERGMALCAVR